MAGLALVAFGVAGGAYALGFWGEASFGPLNPRVSLRIVIPSATALMLGIQLASSAFFMSILGLRP